MGCQIIGMNKWTNLTNEDAFVSAMSLNCLIRMVAM